MSALNKAKGFKKSKSGTYLSMAGTAFGAFGGSEPPRSSQRRANSSAM